MSELVTQITDFIKHSPSEAFLILMISLTFLFVLKLGTKIAKIVVFIILVLIFISASGFSTSKITGHLQKIVDLIMGTP